ncbi:hypothetical protein HPB50_026125 [Hyalomma asiaticum]|uniref:Uncharacterized protein n=1 Tax=Hyalomma asiaticum TaxID=266040 RepID=A0ACB7SC23_HYAAI|nr:hypothetical protein HPB50_026125 [Hyalomma asiaticum]
MTLSRLSHGQGSCDRSNSNSAAYVFQRPSSGSGRRPRSAAAVRHLPPLLYDSACAAYDAPSAAAPVGRSLSRRGRTPPASLDGRRHACIRRRRLLFFPRSSRTGCVDVQQAAAVRPASSHSDRGAPKSTAVVHKTAGLEEARPAQSPNSEPGEEEEQQQEKKTVL